MTMTTTATRRVATYERVSSEDQRERETIKTQTDELARRFDREPGIELVERYVDDGVSGTIPMGARAAGGRLLRDAAARRFDELWVYKVDRLGRDAVDLLIARRLLDHLGVKLVSVVEGEPDLLGYDVQAVVADHYRREFLRRSADGMNRAAREGRYPGGIVPYGYRSQGERQSARLVPDETLVWADLSAAAVVRRMYEHLGAEGWSCRRVADELNALGIPTHYARDGRGIRGRRTRGQWVPGRVRNMVVNPVYRGELRYGRRSAKADREIISAPIEGLVSPALWHAAQETLSRNRTMAKHKRRHYLLRTVIRCGSCGLTYCGSQGRSEVGWYRCNGQLKARGPHVGRCPNPSVRTDAIEQVVWADIEHWLRHPGDVLGEMDGKVERDALEAVAMATSITLARALQSLDEQRERAIGLVVRGLLCEGDLRTELDRVATERAEVERRIAALEPGEQETPPAEAVDRIADVRRRLDAGLTIGQRQEIVHLLVRIVVKIDQQPDGKKRPRALVTYRFPGVVETRTGTGSSPR